MKIIEQSVSFQRTLQIAQYEPVTIFSAIKFETTNEDRETDTEEAYKMVRRDVRKQEDVINYMKSKGKTGSSVYSPKESTKEAAKEITKELPENKPKTVTDLSRDEIIKKAKGEYKKVTN